MENLEEKIKEFICTKKHGYFGQAEIFGEGAGCGSGTYYGSVLGDGGEIDSNYGRCGSGQGVPGAGNSFQGGGGGSIFGFGIKEINGHLLKIIDLIPTLITSVHGNVAQGFIMQQDLQLKPCYIVKENYKFAHGETLHDALLSLQEKLYNNSTEEERISAFKQKFPLYSKKYKNRDLFVYHHVLTGSCRMGREAFIKSKGITLDGMTTVYQFVELTKDAYGGEIVRKLPQAYGMEELNKQANE